MTPAERQARARRLLEEATKYLVRAAADMQAKGIDTAPLSRLAVLIADAQKQLSEPTADPPGECAPPLPHVLFTALNADAPADDVH